MRTRSKHKTVGTLADVCNFLKSVCYQELLKLSGLVFIPLDEKANNSMIENMTSIKQLFLIDVHSTCSLSIH